jgi:NitT/TauT family transport system substrate-binding protein
MISTFGRLAVLFALLLAAPRAYAEAKTIRIAKQYGLGYIQFMIMEDQKIVEKHAKSAGLGDVEVTWGTSTSPASALPASRRSGRGLGATSTCAPRLA